MRGQCQRIARALPLRDRVLQRIPLESGICCRFAFGTLRRRAG